jgi:hypothetical protein
VPAAERGLRLFDVRHHPLMVPAARIATPRFVRKGRSVTPQFRSEVTGARPT